MKKKIHQIKSMTFRGDGSFKVVREGGREGRREGGREGGVYCILGQVHTAFIFRNISCNAS